MSYEIAKTHTLHFDRPPSRMPTNKVPDGPLAGNGDIGLALHCPAPGALALYLGKNDIWNPQDLDNWESAGIRGYGALTLYCPQAAGDFCAEQSLSSATITSRQSSQWGAISLTHTALRGENLILQTVTCTEKEAVIYLDLVHTSRGEDVQTEVCRRNGELLGKKSYTGAKYAWDVHVCSLTRVLGRRSLECTLKKGESLTVATALFTNRDAPDPEAACRALLDGLTDETLSAMQQKHLAWWQNFWNESSVHLPTEPKIERSYYASQYLMACCCAPGKIAPGLFGCWATSDYPAWCGDYHLNYNYEAPFWGLYSSNHIALTDVYDQPLLDYMPKFQAAAQEKLGCRGLYALVGIGPNGLTTACLHDKDGRDDVNYWSQKSNASYAAVNMVMRWRATRDERYARKILPYLTETARFWLDYLTLEDGRYVDRCDCIREDQMAAKGVFDWVNEDTLDESWYVNPILSLGLIRMLLSALLDITDALGVETEEKRRWQDVLDRLSDYPTMERNGKTVFRLTEDGLDWDERNSLAIQHIYPAGAVTLASSPELLAIGRETFRQMARWDDYNAFPTYFPAGARLGIASETLLSHLNRQIETHSCPNGFLFYGGGGIECCSGVVTTINEMLLQSCGGVIRLFPVWDLHADASFTDLRADGAFLVSARCEGGELNSVSVYSEKGGTCRLLLPYDAHVIVECTDKPLKEVHFGHLLCFDTQPQMRYHINISRRSK